MADNPPVVRKATWRIGARQRERLQWTVVAVICGLFLFAVRPIYLNIGETRDFQTCQSHMLQIVQGLKIYEDDFDQALPRGDAWMTVTKGYMAAHSGTGFKVEDLFHCPKDNSGSKSSYAWNSLLDGYSSSAKKRDDSGQTAPASNIRPDRVPLVFEKHGSTDNAQAPITNWDDLAAGITLPHFNPDKPTGSIIFGNLAPSSVTKEKLAIRAGQKF